MSQSASAQIEIDYLRDEIAKLKDQLKDERVARSLLRGAGYFVDNLWHVDDVFQNYNCTKDEAMQVLKKAMINGATMEHVWLAIDDAADDMQVKQIKNQN